MVPAHAGAALSEATVETALIFVPPTVVPLHGVSAGVEATLSEASASLTGASAGALLSRRVISLAIVSRLGSMIIITPVSEAATPGSLSSSFLGTSLSYIPRIVTGVDIAIAMRDGS